MIQVRLFGGFVIEGPNGARLTLPKRRAEALLAVLASDVGREFSRDRLLALLWPENDETRARHGLRDALYLIRRSLGHDALIVEGRQVRLDPSRVDSDVARFARAVSEGRAEDAVAAYGGPLLDGVHLDSGTELEDWVAAERARLADQFVESLGRLALDAERLGRPGEAARWWGRAVEQDPLDAEAVCQQIAVLLQVGDRVGALRAADRHAGRVRDELGVEPDRRIIETIASLRAPSLRERNEPPPQPVERPLRQEPGVARPPPEPVPARRAIGPWGWVLAGLVGIGLVGAAAMLRRAPSSRRESPDRTTIALLPFRSLGTNPLAKVLADGLHEELLTGLAEVGALRVIGRASVSRYDSGAAPLGRVVEELGVGSVVEASVEVEAERVRVRVRLLDAHSGAEVWTETYDRTLADLLALEREISERVIGSVGAVLTQDEAGRLVSTPPRDPHAVLLYLQALHYRRRPGVRRENLAAAEQLLERAVALDSGYAAAHAALAYVHIGMYNLHYDRSATRLAQARAEAKLAARLDPDLSQAHLVVALARWMAEGEFQAALEELRTGLRVAPNDPELWAWVGRVELSLGQWDSALVSLGRATRLDPRNVELYQTVGDAYHYLHHYPEAIAAYRRAQELAPDLLQPRLSLAWSYVLWTGSLDTLRATLATLPLDADPGGGGVSVLANRINLLLSERHPDSALRLLGAVAPAVGDTSDLALFRASMTATARRLLGDTGAARAASELVVTITSARLRVAPERRDLHAGHGLALAWLGRRSEALAEADWLVREEARSGDRFRREEWAWQILALAGRRQAALARLELLLRGPSRTTAPFLRIFPLWEAVRGDSGFETLVARYTPPEPLPLSSVPAGR